MKSLKAIVLPALILLAAVAACGPPSPGSPNYAPYDRPQRIVPGG